MNSVNDIQRILLTTDTLGGVWNYSVELCRGFYSKKIDVALVTMGGPLDRAQREEIDSLKNVTLFSSDFKLEWMDDPWGDIESAGEWILKIQKIVDPQVIHLNQFSFGTLLWEAPVLVVGHSCVFSWYEKVRKHLPHHKWDTYREKVAAGLHAADHVVAPSKAMLGNLLRHYGELRSSSVIYNGCNENLFTPGVKDALVFTAGRIWDEAKNISGLLRSARYLEWPLYVAGEHKRGDISGEENVYFLGKKSTTEMVHLMRSASIYVMPALYEPFGISVLEAAMSGCTLVLGDIDSLREIWDGAAFFVIPQDSEKMCDILQILIHNPQLRINMGNKARARALEFSSERMTDEYLGLYRRLYIMKNESSFNDLPSKLKRHL